MTDLTTMNPRELVRGLMRGDRAELKLGYSAGNAALAAQRAQKIAEPFVCACILAYATGFGAGLQHGDDYNPYGIDVDSEIVAPMIEGLASRDIEIPQDAPRTLALEYRDGVNDGSDEDPAQTCPARTREEGS